MISTEDTNKFMTEPVLGPVMENGNLLKVMINNQNKKTHFTESREE